MQTYRIVKAPAAAPMAALSCPSFAQAAARLVDRSTTFSGAEGVAWVVQGLARAKAEGKK